MRWIRFCPKVVSKDWVLLAVILNSILFNVEFTSQPRCLRGHLPATCSLYGLAGLKFELVGNLSSLLTGLNLPFSGDQHGILFDGYCGFAFRYARVRSYGVVFGGCGT